MYCKICVLDYTDGMGRGKLQFERDNEKAELNFEKHGVTFCEAQEAFFDYHRVILEDLEHSQSEQRYYCLGRLNGNVLTVRFTLRRYVIRIIGAGYWRKGRRIYEKENS